MAKSTAPMSKTDAVRAAIAEGVLDPAEAIVWIKDKYNIVMDKPTFSTLKSNLKARARVKSASTDRIKPVLLAKPSAPPASAADALAAIKEQVDALGADQVIRIAEMLRK